jgi:hypothetical protein
LTWRQTPVSVLAPGSATAASDIERNRDEIADLEELDIAAILGHFADDLVYYTGRSRGTAANHMLIGAEMFIETTFKITRDGFPFPPDCGSSESQFSEL